MNHLPFLLGSVQGEFEEGTGSCYSQWTVYFEKDLAKDFPVAANKVVSKDDHMVLLLLHRCARCYVGELTSCWAAFSQPYIYAFVQGSKLKMLFEWQPAKGKALCKRFYA